MAEVSFAFFRFGRIGRAWENEGDGTTTHCRCRELSVSTLLTLSVWAGMPIRTTDQSALTDGLRLAGSGQRFRPKGHRAIADMFCWLAARVALLWEMTHLCSNPQTVGRGSARRFPIIVPKAAPQGVLRWHCQPLLAVLGKIFRCKGMKPLSDGLGIHCQQAEIFLIIA